MKKITSFILVCVLFLTGCAQSAEKGITTQSNEIQTSIEDEKAREITSTESLKETLSSQESLNDLSSNLTNGYAPEKEENNFSSLNDPNLLQYVEDTVYTRLVDDFHSENYVIENVNAIYISKEYLEEVAYNSQSNIWFGHTLDELEEQFDDNKYVFTLSEDGSTVVTNFEDYDDTYDKVIKNVAIGSGIILVCVVVSVATAGAATPTVSMVFAASAKTATSFALSSGMIGGVSSGIITGIQTGDMNQAAKAAALSGSEGFKWGAITGAVVGGVSELSAINRVTKSAEKATEYSEGTADIIENGSKEPRIIKSSAKSFEGATEYARGAVEITDDLPAWRQAELRALNEYGGYEQLSYLDGELVDFGTPGATRPDVIVDMGDHLEAIEVKYYNLESAGCRSTLYSELEREVTDRVTNLPVGSTQRIILDVTDRGFSADTVDC